MITGRANVIVLGTTRQWTGFFHGDETAGTFVHVKLHSRGRQKQNNKLYEYWFDISRISNGM